MRIVALSTSHLGQPRAASISGFGSLHPSSSLWNVGDEVPRIATSPPVGSRRALAESASFRTDRHWRMACSHNHLGRHSSPCNASRISWPSNAPDYEIRFG